MSHVWIIGNHIRGKDCYEAFKIKGLTWDFLCQWDYADQVVDIFANQTQYEYYGGNIYICFEGIALEHFCDPQ